MVFIEEKEMSCLTWFYKKISSIPKPELMERLWKFYEDFQDTWISKSRKEDYCRVCSSTFPGLESLSINQNPEEEWDLNHRNMNLAGNLLEEISQSEDVLIEEVVKFLQITTHDTIDFQEHKGDWYLLMGVNPGFSVYTYNLSLRPIDTYEDLVAALERINPQSIEYYGESGSKEILIGLGDELKEYLKFLYKNNDVYVRIG